MSSLFGMAKDLDTERYRNEVLRASNERLTVENERLRVALRDMRTIAGAALVGQPNSDGTKEGA